MSRAARTRGAGSPSAATVLFLNLLATVHVVWFYLSRVECHIRLLAYEQGRERTPFQYRLLLMGPLGWAHRSPAIVAAAAWLTRQRGFFPNGVRPEGLVQAAIDMLCVAVAGLMATRIYERASRTGLLAAYVYPLTLLMVLCTYALLTMHSYRFVYDLPSLAFFSLGLYLIYARKHAGWLAAVFVLGTINRETTLLLVVFFVLARCSEGERPDWRQCYAARTLSTVLPLATFWVGWHLWVSHLFRANPSVIESRVGLNLGILAIPLTWPQLLDGFAYLLPLVLLCRAQIEDRVLRAWLWALPIWLVCMLYYGVLIETRLFGELIPYLACVAALIAEQGLLPGLRRHAPESLAVRADGAIRPR